MECGHLVTLFFYPSAKSRITPGHDAATGMELGCGEKKDWKDAGDC